MVKQDLQCLNRSIFRQTSVVSQSAQKIVLSKMNTVQTLPLTFVSDLANQLTVSRLRPTLKYKLYLLKGSMRTNLSNHIQIQIG